jgi:hypothetical protein
MKGGNVEEIGTSAGNGCASPVRSRVRPKPPFIVSANAMKRRTLFLLAAGLAMPGLLTAAGPVRLIFDTDTPRPHNLGIGSSSASSLSHCAIRRFTEGSPRSNAVPDQDDVRTWWRARYPATTHPGSSSGADHRGIVVSVSRHRAGTSSRNVPPCGRTGGNSRKFSSSLVRTARNSTPGKPSIVTWRAAAMLAMCSV